MAGAVATLSDSNAATLAFKRLRTSRDLSGVLVSSVPTLESRLGSKFGRNFAARAASIRAVLRSAFRKNALWRGGNQENAVRTKLAFLVATTVMAAATGLTGCNRQAVAQSGNLTLTGSKYCSPFPSTSVPSNATSGLAPAANIDPAVSFDDCIHRWGYALAPSRDPADVVAQASVEACSSILANWSQQIGQASGAEPARYSERGRRETQQAPPDPEAQRMHAAEGRALFYVVQARAGGCAAPPANTLVSPTTQTSYAAATPPS
jgi:hypothetical protein